MALKFQTPKRSLTLKTALHWRLPVLPPQQLESLMQNTLFTQLRSWASFFVRCTFNVRDHVKDTARTPWKSWWCNACVCDGPRYYPAVGSPFKMHLPSRCEREHLLRRSVSHNVCQKKNLHTSMTVSFWLKSTVGCTLKMLYITSLSYYFLIIAFLH